MTIRPQRIAIVLALSLGGLALMGALTAAAAPATPHTIRTYPGLSAPCNTTLQACIDGSAPGDQIHIRDGLYITSAVLTKSVSLIGFGEGLTFIQPPPGQRGLTISGTVTEAAEIAHFTIQNAAHGAGNGGGLLVLAPASPTLHHLTIQSNTVTQAGARGGGMFVETSITLTQITLRNNTVAHNGRGGGLGVSLLGNVTIISSTFIGNSAGSLPTSTAASHGGGLYTDGSAVIIGSVFQSNRAITGSAGAVFAMGSLFITGSTFTGSTSHDSGGAIFAGGPLTLYSSLVAESISTGGSGAGARAASTAVVSDTQFISNTAFNPGGGLRVTLDTTIHNTDFISNTSGGSGGGLRANANAFITGGSFVANTGTAGGGALIPGTATVSQTLFQGNTASVRGGGLDVVTATVQEATFDDNEVAAGNGGGLHALNVLTITDSLFTANRVLSGTQADATGSGGGLFSDGVLTSMGNTFIGNFAFRLGGGADVDDAVSAGDVFRGNLTGPQGSGGGMFVAGVFVVDSGQFYTNTANTAGGLGVNSTAAGEVFNSLFAQNVVTFTDGGAALRLLSATFVTLTHNTLVGTNQASRAAVHFQGAGDFWLYANLIANFAQGLKQFGSTPTSTVTVEHSLFDSVSVPYIGVIAAGGSNITGTAAFLNPAAFDYHLGPGSDGLDAAPSYGLAVDFEGQPRPIGPGFDIGFDEVVLRLWLPSILR